MVSYLFLTRLFWSVCSRNELFRVSDIRGHYPQSFLVDSRGRPKFSKSRRYNGLSCCNILLTPSSFQSVILKRSRKLTTRVPCQQMSWRNILRLWRGPKFWMGKPRLGSCIQKLVELSLSTTKNIISASCRTTAASIKTMLESICGRHYRDIHRCHWGTHHIDKSN